MERTDLRNLAIIAHVDHGKTTLVDQMLKQSGAFRDNQQVADRVMDSGDIERERGITILAKNCSTVYNGVKINIVDTPGHADFGGEVERVLKMVNGVLLLVDAAEGCMPQTRFVLQKALQQNLSLVIAVNKIDRPDARIKEVIDEILLLLMDLGATDEQLDSPMVFCSGRSGTASYSPDVPGTDLKPLFETILEYVKCPEGDPEAPFQMLCSSVDYNDFVGRIGIGRIQNGSVKVNQDVQVCDWHDQDVNFKGRITKLYDFKANGREPVDEAKAGDIVAFSGITDVTIGNTLCDPAQVKPLPFLKINDPTVEMTFSVNDSPFAGREGKFVTSRQIRDRLQRELLKDVALKVEDSATSDSFRVMGRGEMHLSILIETMRREGYELQVSPPKVLTHVENGKTMEPMERVVVDVPTDYQGAVMTALGARKAILQQMEPIGTRVRLEFRMPSRGLFGYRNQFLTDTHGEGILNTIFDGYEEWQGDISCRSTGSLVSFETGDAVTYGLYNAQGRGDPARQGHPLRAAQLWHGCRKHLAAVPGQRRLLPRIPAQKACQLLKGPVALLLAVQLVVQLKIVQIQQQQGKRASRRPLVFQRRQKCPAVQKAGELVGARLPVKPAIQPCIFQPHRHHRPHRGQKHQIVVGVVPLGGRRAQKQDSLQAFIVLEGHNAPDAVPAHHAELILCNLHARPLHLGGPHTSLLRAEPGGAGVLRPNGLHLVFQPRRIRRQKLLPPLVQQKHAGGAFAVDLLHLPPHRVHQLLPRQVVRRGHAEPLQRQVSLPLF